MTAENCPWCGAEPEKELPSQWKWICGSIDKYSRKKLNQSDACSIRELEQENEKLGAVVEALKKYIQFEPSSPKLKGRVWNHRHGCIHCFNCSDCDCGKKDIIKSLRVLDAPADGRKAMMLRWTYKKPKVPGIYLRNNPFVKSIVRQDVFELDGLLTTCSNDGDHSLIRIVDLSDTFLWYGPIPTEGLPRWNDTPADGKESENV